MAGSSNNDEQRDGIFIGYVVEGEQRKLTEGRLKRVMDPRTYDLSIQGHRMLVGQDKADEMYRGVIAKPKRAQEEEQRGIASGWVLGVGPMCGQPGAPHPTGVLCEHPKNLLGKHVYYQMWAGKVFRTDDDDGEFDTKDSLIILTDRDVQAISDD